MKGLKNYNDYKDYIILEKFINNKISEREFLLYFITLNEKLTFSSISKKIENVVKWVINNMKKLGKKILNKIIIISKTIINSAKSFLPKKTLKIIILIFVMLITQISFANINGTLEGGNEGKKTELTISKNTINESKKLLNSAIGFLSLLEKDNDIMQAIGILSSIRDGLASNNLDANQYKYLSNKAKEIIKFTLKMMKDNIKEIDSESDILLMETYVKLGERISSTFDLNKHYKFVKIIDTQDSTSTTWNQRNNF